MRDDLVSGLRAGAEKVPPMSLLDQLADAVHKGRAEDVLVLIENGLATDIPARELLNDGLLKGIELIGARFKRNEVWVPEVMGAAGALNLGLARLKPQLIDTGGAFRGRIVIGTVHGDLHDIGKNLVKLMLEGSGFEVIDLGINVPTEQFVTAVKKYQPSILCLSVLLSTLIGELRSVITAIDSAGIREEIKILVGGAPVTSDIAKSVGADGYAQDAVGAAELVSRLISSAA